MAGSGSAIRAGRAFVELYADESKLVRGLKSAENRLKSWGANVTSIGAKIFGVGAGIVAAFIPAVAIFANMGSKLDDLSQRSGASVESLSSLGYAAQQSGADLDTLGGGIRKMQQNLADAAGGSESASKAFAALGLNVDELMSMSPDEQFRTIAEAMSKIQDPAKKTAAAMDIFGKSGSDLLPMLSAGRAGIEAMEERAKALGLVMSGEDATAAAKLGDTWDELMAVGQSLAKTIGAALAPDLIAIGQSFVETAAGVVHWIDQNRELIATAAKIGAVLAGVGAAIVAVGVGLSLAAVVVGGFSAAIAAIPLIISGLTTAFFAVVSPIGLAIAGVTALAGAFIYFSGIGSAAIEYMNGIGESIKNAFGGIAAEIKNGDLAGAWQIAMGAANIEIQKALLSAKRLVYGAVQDIRKMIIDLANFIPGKLGKVLGKGLDKGLGGVIDMGAGGNKKQVEAGFKMQEQGIEMAQAALKSLIDKAKIEAEGRFTTTPKIPRLDQIEREFPGGGDEKKTEEKKTSSAGTFNSTAAGRLGGKGADEQIAHNTGKSLDLLTQIKELLKRQKGPVFAG